MVKLREKDGQDAINVEEEEEVIVEEEVDGVEEVEEDVTTAEFNYFLSKRARAVS